MIRRLIESTVDPAVIHPGLADHQADMIQRCPYLGPSVERGLTVWSAWAASDGDQAELFAMLVDNAEGLRKDRRKHGPLVCRNIALLGPSDIDSARKVMDWPAWLARNQLVASMTAMGNAPQRGDEGCLTAYRIAVEQVGVAAQ